jgi:hypothetical protein
MRIGIIGYGSAGRRHVANLIRLGERELVIYDPDRDLKLPDVGRGYVDVFDGPVFFKAIVNKEQFVDGSYDAVVIASPASTHASWLRIAAERGWPTLCEKPIATNKTLGDIPAISEFRAPVMIGYNWLWHRQLIEDVNPRLRTATEVQVSVETDMTTWPGADYASALLECSHELAVLDSWCGAVSLLKSHLTPTGGVLLGLAGSCPFTFSWDVASGTAGRTWVVRGVDGERAMFSYSHFDTTGKGSLDDSYVAMMAEFLQCAQIGWRPQNENEMLSAVRVVRLCIEADGV